MYKGKLENGQGIAIVRTLSKLKVQDYMRNEAALLVRLEHENLAQLLGYCIEGTLLHLVYEFAPYASLDHLIFDPSKCTLLDWNKRNRIILGVARVLVYLHKRAPVRIVHCDVKPSNVILDESLEPKLSGCWSARCLTINDTECIEVGPTFGTLGYMAPELFTHSRLSTKADVFSFGVLVLETISGCSMYDSRFNGNFRQYMWTKWWEGTSSNIVDPTLDADSSSIRTFIQIGLLCVQADAADRPTMAEVVGMLLSGSFLTLPAPKSPMHLDYTNAPEILASNDYDSRAVEDFISELHAR